MAENTVVETIERQAWLDPLADQLQQAVGDAYKTGGETGRQLKNFLHGTWLGHPLHPVLTDIPIGAWTSALVLDSMEEITGRAGFGSGADAAVTIGLVGAVASAVTGVTDWQATDGRARKIGLAHGLLNMTGALLYTCSLAARRKGSRAAGRGLSAVGFVAAIAAAYLGGKLVYSEQIGVDHSIDQPLPDDFTRALPESELPDGTMKRVDVNGARVLVARCDGRVYAIGEVCSHLGGPLAEGEFKDCTVTCPWHGSRFSLEDGRVLDGPATHGAHSLETRIQDGEIQVRRAR